MLSLLSVTLVTAERAVSRACQARGPNKTSGHMARARAIYIKHDNQAGVAGRRWGRAIPRLPAAIVLFPSPSAPLPAAPPPVPA